MDPLTTSLLINGSIIAGGYAYHRWIDPPEKPKPIREMQVPRVDEGAPIPLLYGRCRVRQPILAWISEPKASEVVEIATAYDTFAHSFLYGALMFYVVGKTMEGQVATLHNIWASDRRMTVRPPGTYSNFGGPDREYVALGDLWGTGNNERDTRRAQISLSAAGQHLIGEVELLNGGTNQLLVDPVTFVPTTWAGAGIVTDGTPGDEIPGYRGLMCVYLHGLPVEDDNTEDDIENHVEELPDGFVLGTAPQIPPFSFEAWAITQSPVGTVSVVDSGDGPIELNPMDALVDLLSGTMGKLGIPLSRIDRTGTFRTAANILAEEGIGFSRCFEDTGSAGDKIKEIERLVDGVTYEDPSDGRIKFKLIRPDWNPADCRKLAASNCEIENYEVTGTTNPITSARALFTNRSKGYTDDSAIAPNQALGSTYNQINDAEFAFPGCCTRAMALKLASRELAFITRPMARATVLADRSFIRTVPGDVVEFNSTELTVGAKYFRVAAVERGTLSDGRIRLHLIEEIYFAHRGLAPEFELPPAYSI